MTVADFEAEEKKKSICSLILDKQQRNLISGKSLFLALSWGAVQSQTSLSPSASGQVHLTSKLYRPTPLLRTIMMMQMRNSMTICRKSCWTSPLGKTSL